MTGTEHVEFEYTVGMDDEERAAFDGATINEPFGPVRVFGESLEDLEVTVYELDAGSTVGRRTRGADV